MNVTMHTSLGDIRITLFDTKAPKTVDNFVGLAEGTKDYQADGGRKSPEKYYDGLTFHRIIPGFMIQGGCPTGTGMGGPGYTFDDEIHPELNFNAPYVLAMANAGLRGGKGTNGSQFFITTDPTPWLQGKHTIFGEVADEESKKVVDAIAAVKTGRGDKPVEPVVITSVEIQK